MASFYIPLTGLNADSTALNTIANDLSNMNTTAYKGQTTNFSDLFYQQVGSSGSGNEIQVGEGVQVASNETDFSQGSLRYQRHHHLRCGIERQRLFCREQRRHNLYTRDGDFHAGRDRQSDHLRRPDGDGLPGGEWRGEHQCAVDGDQHSRERSGAAAGGNHHLRHDRQSGFSLAHRHHVSRAVTLYDSLGISYQAAVNYTKTGTNTVVLRHFAARYGDGGSSHGCRGNDHGRAGVHTNCDCRDHSRAGGSGGSGNIYQHPYAVFERGFCGGHHNL